MILGMGQATPLRDYPGDVSVFVNVNKSQILVKWKNSEASSNLADRCKFHATFEGNHRDEARFSVIDVCHGEVQ